MSGMLTEIGNVLTAVGGWLVDLFKAMAEIFYDTTATTPGFTLLGYFLLVGLGLFIVSLIINWIKGFIRV